MAPLPQPLKGSRTDVAAGLSDGRWRTAKEIASTLGRPTGSVFGLVQRMRADGLLEADQEPPTRGTQYRLTPAGQAALEEAMGADDPVGELQSGQWLLVIEHPGAGARITDQAKVLADRRHSGSVAWSASLGWGTLVVLRADVDDPFPAEALGAALEQHGYVCRVAQATTLLAASQLRDRAATLSGAKP